MSFPAITFSYLFTFLDCVKLIKLSNLKGCKPAERVDIPRFFPSSPYHFSYLMHAKIMPVAAKSFCVWLMVPLLFHKISFSDTCFYC